MTLVLEILKRNTIKQKIQFFNNLFRPPAKILNIQKNLRRLGDEKNTRKMRYEILKKVQKENLMKY
jgi:hypothetical protein